MQTTTFHTLRTASIHNLRSIAPCGGLALPMLAFLRTTARHFKDEPQASNKPVDAKPVAILPADLSEAHNDWVLFHPVYNPADLEQVKVVHHERKGISDAIAAGLVRAARLTFDFSTGYRHASPAEAVANATRQGKHLSLQELREQGLVMTPKQWMSRILFLESIAGVPGMVAGVLRHLRSLRTLKRDGGWISTMLEEAENERMHLLTFLKISQPGRFMRLMILGAQGVFFNMMFLAYMISPRACHRFVGQLEEEACYTYTTIIGELEAGRLPEWENIKVPQIAKDYWRMGENASMHDLLLNVRADEANHRFTNHTLANLDHKNDHNPFAIRQPDPAIRGTISEFTREEALAWANESVDYAKAKLEANIRQQKEAAPERPVQ